jgi:predicted secreted protein
VRQFVIWWVAASRCLSVVFRHGSPAEAEPMATAFTMPVAPEAEGVAIGIAFAAYVVYFIFNVASFAALTGYRRFLKDW